MLVISGLFVAALTGQSLAMPPSSPAVECSEYLTDWRARRNCLRGLLSEAGDGLDDAVDAARAEADEIDADSGGHFGARRALDAAQTAWLAYRDAECARRAAAMFLSADSRGDHADLPGQPDPRSRRRTGGALRR